MLIMLELKVTDDFLQQCMSSIDQDDDKLIAFDEFLELMVERETQTLPAAVNQFRSSVKRTLFRGGDVNGRGIELLDVKNPVMV